MELLYGLEVTAEIEVIPAGTLQAGDLIEVKDGKLTVLRPEPEEDEE